LNEAAQIVAVPEHNVIKTCVAEGRAPHILYIVHQMKGSDRVPVCAN